MSRFIPKHCRCKYDVAFVSSSLTLALGILLSPSVAGDLSFPYFGYHLLSRLNVQPPIKGRYSRLFNIRKRCLTKS
uniref:Uncharacterized protein n=1 Tax=Pararge aegeria TaxID=116150 RepID=S4PXK9_9NEOP